MGNISENFKKIRDKIEERSAKLGRDPSKIKLVAISKGKTAEDVLEAYETGQRVFGENYAQELQEKYNLLRENVGIEWHFTGHLQKNKAKVVAPIISCIETIDSIELAKAMEKRATKPIKALIEVNIGGEGSKSGVKPEDLKILVKKMTSLEKLRLKGLMIIPPYSDNPEDSRPYFKKLRELLGELNSEKIYTEKLTELSMGMSHDFEIAIEEGATIVRVGTAIFGERGE